MSKSYKRQRAELRQSIESHQTALQQEVRRGGGIFRNSGRKILLGLGIVSVAYVLASWVSRPKVKKAPVVPPPSSETNTTTTVVQSEPARPESPLMRAIRQEITAFIRSFLKEAALSLLQELPRLLGSKSTNTPASEENQRSEK